MSPEQILDSLKLLTLALSLETRALNQPSTQRQNERHIFVAESDLQIVGFKNVGDLREKEPGIPGELYALYLLVEFHKCGI